MPVTEDVIHALIGLGATGITASTALLVSLALKVARIEAKLEIHSEELSQIKRKLPNGEVEQIYSMVRELHKRFGAN